MITGTALRIVEEPPARLPRKRVNGDAGLGFGGHGTDSTEIRVGLFLSDL